MTNQGVRIPITADGAQAVQAFRTVENSLGGVQRQATIANASFKQLALTFAGGTLAANGVQSMVAGLKQVPIALIDAQVQADRLRQQLGTVFGNGNIGRETAYLVSVSNKLGLSLAETANSYAKFAAAAKGTSLEGAQARKVFESIGNAAAKMGLSTAEADGALNALQQMISKGTVSAEELRGQLGERLPGAFQMAARAMGVTTAELGKMLELGQIAATDLLPKLADEMNKTFGTGSSIDTAQATLNRLGTAWTQFKTSLTDAGAASPALDLLKMLTDRLNAAAEAMEAARKAGWGGTGQAFAGVGGAMLGDAQATQRATINDRLASAQRDVVINQSRIKGLWGNDLRLAIEQLDNAKAKVAALEKEWTRLHTGKVDMPKLADVVRNETEQAEQARAKYLAERRTSSQKMADEIKAENSAFNALRDKDAVAEAAHRERLAEIQKKYDKGAADAIKEKARLYKEAMAEAQSYVAETEGNAARYAQDAERLKEEAIQIDGGAQALARYRAEKLEATAATYELSAGIYENAAAFALESKAGTEAVAVYQRLAEAARDSAAALRDQATRTVANEGAKQAKKDYEETEKAAEKAAKDATADSAREWQKFADDIERSLTDALFRAFENGDDFGEAFVETLKNTLKSTVLKVAVQAIVDPITGGIRSLLGGGEEGGGVGGAVGSALNIGSTLSTLKTLWTNLGPIANGSYVANQFGSLAKSEFGQTLGLSNATDIGADGKLIFELSENGASFDKIFNSASFKSAAAGIAGALVGGAIAGDYRVNDKVSMAQIGAAIGSFVPVIGGFVGGVVGGIVDRAFGMGPKKVKDYGIKGTFANGDFSGRTYEFWKQKGGWARSDKKGTNYGKVGSELDSYLGNTFVKLKLEVASMASTLGANVSAIADYSKKATVSFRGGEEKQKQRLQKLFDGMSEDMAKLALAGTNLSKDGETARATLERLSSSFVNVNVWLARLRQTTLQTSVASGAAASNLLELFGGLEKFNEAESKYFDLYYTEGEKVSAVQQALADTLGQLGLRVPESKDALKALIDSLNLTTESGRAAYATLVQLAPTFADSVAIIEAQARETAEKLLIAYSGNGKLVPALDALALVTTNTSNDIITATGAISVSFLDASSGLITFGETAVLAAGELDATQIAALMLTDSITALKLAADGSIIDIEGLSAALENFDTATFVATMAGVFESIGARVRSTLADITSERIALRNDAIRILDPAPLSASAIERGISSVGLAMPDQTALLSASAALALADSGLTAAQESYASLNASLSQVGNDLAARYVTADVNRQELYALAGKKIWVNQTNGPIQKVNDAYSVQADGRLSGFAQITESTTDKKVQEFNAAAWAGPAAALELDRAAIDAMVSQISNLGSAITDQAAAITTAQNAQTTAAIAARKAQSDYVAELQAFSIDASKSVTKLGRLREETVRFYETQKALAEQMLTGASALRSTVEQIKFSQLSDAQKFATLDTQFGTAYAMALSTNGDTLSGYGEKINELLTPLLDAASNALDASAYATYQATALARTEAIAGRLEFLAPTGYEAESLGLLSQIDTTLAALEASSLDANSAIVGAINASKDLTVSGLRAVVAALTGQTVPAFATGGYHDGGLRLVGENGPELEATGASRIWSAADTRRILQSGEKVGAGETALLAELAALRAEVSALRAETRATAINTGKSARYAERWDVDGLTVRNDADTPLITEAAA